MHFLRTLRPRIVITTLLKIIFTYNGKTVDDESSARGSFVKKKKYIVSERSLVKQVIL